MDELRALRKELEEEKEKAREKEVSRLTAENAVLRAEAAKLPPTPTPWPQHAMRGPFSSPYPVGNPVDHSAQAPAQAVQFHHATGYAAEPQAQPQSQPKPQPKPQPQPQQQMPVQEEPSTNATPVRFFSKFFILKLEIMFFLLYIVIQVKTTAADMARNAIKIYQQWSALAPAEQVLEMLKPEVFEAVKMCHS